MELLEKSRNFRYVIAILEISHFEFLNGILLGSISDVILKGIMLLAEVNVNVLNCLICFLIFCRNETHI